MNRIFRNEAEFVLFNKNNSVFYNICLPLLPNAKFTCISQILYWIFSFLLYIGSFKRAYIFGALENTLVIE